MQNQSPNPHSITTMQLKRSIRKRVILFLVQLIVVGDDVKDIMTLPSSILLEEFVDVFEPLPSGLPPQREMIHIISLELYRKPSFRLICRMSPLELQEAKMQIKEYLKNGWIELNSSPYESPILFFKKYD